MKQFGSKVQVILWMTNTQTINELILPVKTQMLFSYQKKKKSELYHCISYMDMESFFLIASLQHPYLVIQKKDGVVTMDSAYLAVVSAMALTLAVMPAMKTTTISVSITFSIWYTFDATNDCVAT